MPGGMFTMNASSGIGRLTSTFPIVSTIRACRHASESGVRARSRSKNFLVAFFKNQAFPGMTSW